MTVFEIIAFVSFLLSIGGVGVVLGKTLSAVKALHDRLDTICANDNSVAAEERNTRKENGIYRNGEADRIRNYRNNEAPLRACADKFSLIQDSLGDLKQQMAILIERSEQGKRN